MKALAAKCAKLATDMPKKTAEIADAQRQNKQQRGNHLNLRPQDAPVVTVSNFWRYPYITEAEFKDQAECGDILLFRGMGGRCQLIRSVTSGKYDHVALI